MYLFYLKEKPREQNSWQEIIHLLVQQPNAHNSQEQVRQKPGAQSLIQVPHCQG